jgi:hypothetical protein
MVAWSAPWIRARWVSVRTQAQTRRRTLQICLGLVWLLDAALQFQPYMFGPFFVTQGIQLSTAGNPAVVASSASWASHLMLGHIALYNSVFATIQLLIAAGILWRRTVKLALAASVIWAVSVWWFGESLGGIFIGASPLAGVPGGVILYALIAILLWPPERPDTDRPGRPASAATSGPLGVWANLAWLVLWGSFCYYLLLPANRAPGAISDMFSVTDAQPGWLTAIMNGLASAAGQRGLAISVVLAIACAAAAVGVFSTSLIRPALVLASALGLLFWIAEGLGGIFTGEGTDPNTGPLLILLAACFWPLPSRSPLSQSGAAADFLAVGFGEADREVGAGRIADVGQVVGHRVAHGDGVVGDHEGAGGQQRLQETHDREVERLPAVQQDEPDRAGQAG